MDGSMFAEAAKTIVWFCVIVALAIAGSCGLGGYYLGKHGGCGYHVKVEKDPPPPPPDQKLFDRGHDFQ